MKTIKTFLLIGLPLALSAVLAHSADQTMDKAPSTAPITNDFLIVEGQSIGNVQLGDNPDRVHEVLGTPSFTALMGRIGDHGDHYDSGIDVSYRDFKVAALSTTSSKFKTESGFSVGSNADVIRQNYKGGALNKVSPNVYVYTDGKRGIKFQFGNDKNHTTKWCDTIIVVKATP